MAVEKKRQLKPGPPGKTAERAHFIRLMKQGFNNSEVCRIVGVGRKTGSHWRNGRTVRDPATGQIRSYPCHHHGAGAARGHLCPVTCPRTSGSPLPTGTAPERACAP